MEKKHTLAFLFLVSVCSAAAEHTGFESIQPNLYRLQGAGNVYLLRSGPAGLLIDAGTKTAIGKTDAAYLQSISTVPPKERAGRYLLSWDLVRQGGYVQNLYSMQWIYLKHPGIDSSIVSMDRIRQQDPELLLPSHGPLITQPALDLQRMKSRLRAFQASFHIRRAGRWNGSGFVQVSEHVIMASHWHADHIDGIPALADGIKFYFTADGSSSNREEFVDWALKTTDNITALLPPGHSETGFNPYWTTFYPARISLDPGEKRPVALRIKNAAGFPVSGRIWLKSHPDIVFPEKVLEYELAPGEEGSVPVILKVRSGCRPGTYIISADIEFDGEFYGEYPHGYIVIDE